MPPLPKKKHSRRRSAGRFQRYRHASYVPTVECPQCHDTKLPHRVCRNCGYYNGREMIATREASAT